MMKGLTLGTALLLGATAATAQTMSHGVHATAPAPSMGAASAAARLQAQGYTEIHNLKQAPDGSWTAGASRNGAPLTVIEGTDGRITTH